VNWEKTGGIKFDLLVTAEAKSIPLAYALAVEMKKPYVVLRKTYKPYMGEALRTETLSITTGQPQMLVLDEKDREMMEGKKVMLVDDVISTGSTVQGMRMLMEKAGAEVAGEAAILTEGIAPSGITSSLWGTCRYSRSDPAGGQPAWWVAINLCFRSRVIFLMTHSLFIASVREDNSTT